MKHVDTKALISVSREVVQTADDSSEIAVKRMEADRINATRTPKRPNWPMRVLNPGSDMQAGKMPKPQLPTPTAARMQADQATADAQRQQQNAQAESDRNRAAAADANQATADAQQSQRTQRRIQNATALPPQTQINSSSKP